ncbi:hypothetical protein O6H91_Y158600 [Diphasiastrum complanatum]|nr:hypothetical protein O6H91_Y158600 [Diphasiastrum complanatum]
MRLTFHIHNSHAKGNVQIFEVTFPPLQGGSKRVTYHTLLWQYYSKRDSTDEVAKLEVMWIDHCLTAGETLFLKDLNSRGFVLDEAEISVLASALREELIFYITQLDLKQGRNTAAHVFCSALTQNVIK